MPNPRVTPKRAPVSPGRDSRFTLKTNPDQNREWWVYYEPQGADPIPADQAHPDLVELLTVLKGSEGHGPGGGFSINEHSQVIARTSPSGGHQDQAAVHVIGIENGDVVKYANAITFQGGSLDPANTPDEGDPWPGPACGTTYTFAAPDARRAPFHRLDDVRIEVNGAPVFLSAHCGLPSYPPSTGPLRDFLMALRRQIPGGGRFRVNERGRAFTSEGNRFIGIVPLGDWFRPIQAAD
jgi:hypothetical protein